MKKVKIGEKIFLPLPQAFVDELFKGAFGDDQNDEGIKLMVRLIRFSYKHNYYPDNILLDDKLLKFLKKKYELPI